LYLDILHFRQRLYWQALIGGAIITLCRVLRVNRSSYYKHFKQTESKRSIENQNIRTCILQIYSDSKCRYDIRKMCRVLETKYGITISPGLLTSTDLFSYVEPFPAISAYFSLLNDITLHGSAAALFCFDRSKIKKDLATKNPYFTLFWRWKG